MSAPTNPTPVNKTAVATPAQKAAVPSAMQAAQATMQAAAATLQAAEIAAQAAQARVQAAGPNAPVAGALQMAAKAAQMQVGQAAGAQAAAMQAYDQAVMQAVLLSKEVSGIRVHNTGAFEMSFYIGFPDSSTSGNSATFGVGDQRTISVALTPPFLNNAATGSIWAAGTSICPFANIEYGVSNHGAEAMVTFNAASPNVAVYNCGGGVDNPSFSLQSNSADVGSNGGLPGLESSSKATGDVAAVGNFIGQAAGGE